MRPSRASARRRVDLRSDTVTQPTPQMREAMYRAEVGDDGYGEDPTVNRLEALAAERLSKQAALFVASGTMGNLVALLAHCERGDEVVLGDQSHIFWYEMGGISALGGVHVRTVRNNEDGTLPLEALQTAMRPDWPKFPRTSLVCLENTQNRCSGAVLPLEYTATVAHTARAAGAHLHMDGARIFNAAVALGLPAAAVVQEADSVQFCLSKGLSAPVGSLICGDAAFIKEARRWRQAVGGAMRQAGVIAAAGIVGLERMVDRLAEDHENARALINGLANIPGLQVHPKAVQTNIVMVRPTAVEAGDYQRRLAQQGVLVSNYWGGVLRAVTHYGIERDDIDYALEAFQKAMTGPE